MTTFCDVQKDEPHFYTRWEHGTNPVWLLDGDGRQKRILMQPQDEGIQEFPSARQFFLTLYNGRDHHQTMMRYFRIGPKSQEPEKTILDIFGQPFFEGAKNAPLIITRPKRELGIDLAKRGHEVAKLLFAGFGSRILRSGFDPQEVLQEVYRGLLARNRGKCPWDEEKSSFSHYVHMVCGCILNNYHKREYKRRGREVDVEDSTMLLLNESAKVAEQVSSEDEMAVQDLTRWIHHRYGDLTDPEKISLACRVVPLLQDGLTRQEMSDRLDVGKGPINRAVKLVREAALSWNTD